MKEFYYIYCLINPQNNQPFYVGKGKHSFRRSPRWREHVTEAKRWSPSCHWGNTKKLSIIKSLLAQGMEPNVEVVLETPNESIAFAKEKELIVKYGRLANESGILTNLTEGGEGVDSLKKFDAEERFRRSKRMAGKNNSMYGKKHTREAKQRMSETKRRRLANGQIIPKKHTEAHKQKLRENNPGGKATRKPVQQICPKTGEALTIFPSTKQAGEVLGIRSWRNISYTCNHYPDRTVGGFRWRWAIQ